MKKSAIVGLLLGIMIGALAARANQETTISLTVSIPETSSYTASIIEASNLDLTKGKAQTRLRITNTGTATQTLTHQTTAPNGLTITLAHITGTGSGSPVSTPWTNQLTIPRGDYADISITIVHVDAPPGTHPIQIHITN